MEEMLEEIMDFQKKGRYDLMYQKEEELAKSYERLELKKTKET